MKLFSKKAVNNATWAIVVSILLLLIVFGYFLLKLKSVGTSFG